MLVVLSGLRLNREHVLSGVRERTVSRVVKESGEADDLAVPLKISLGIAESRDQILPGAADHGIEELSRDVHDAQRMLETGMHGPRVDIIGPGQLANSSQPLKGRMVDDVTLPAA